MNTNLPVFDLLVTKASAEVRAADPLAELTLMPVTSEGMEWFLDTFGMGVCSVNLVADWLSQLIRSADKHALTVGMPS